MTEKELLLLSVENDALILKALAGLWQDSLGETFAATLKSRAKRLEALLDEHLDKEPLSDVKSD